MSDSYDSPMTLPKRDLYEECNIQIVNCSTAAQYFHVLRRQMLRPFRKPLIVVAPKKMLKMREVASDMSEFVSGTEFRRVLPDVDEVKPANCKRVVLCSGQVYYDLLAERTKLKKNDVALVRVEQLAPFPFNSLSAELKKYPRNAEIVWAQEEQKNAGCWSFFEPRIRGILQKIGQKNIEVGYAGRPISASTATGYGKHHKE